MDRLTRRVLVGSAIVLAVSCLMPTLAAAQTWAPSRLPDGQPDVQGFWQPGPGAINAGHSYEEGCCEAEHNKMQDRPVDQIGLRQQIIIEPANGTIPFQPWAEKQRMEHMINLDAPTEIQHIEPEDRCSLQGVPRSNLRGPIQILQTPGQIVLLFEWVHAYRVIPVDGRPHAPKGASTWQGDSRGRWEGHTLVIEATNFRYDPVGYNKQPWLDSHGTFYTDSLRVVERWTFVDANTVDYEATIEDPKVFTQPWTIAYQIERMRQKNFEMFEEACWEGVELSNRLEGGRITRKKSNLVPHGHANARHEP